MSLTAKTFEIAFNIKVWPWDRFAFADVAHLCAGIVERLVFFAAPRKGWSLMGYLTKSSL